MLVFTTCGRRLSKIKLVLLLCLLLCSIPLVQGKSFHPNHDILYSLEKASPQASSNSDGNQEEYFSQITPTKRFLAATSPSLSTITSGISDSFEGVTQTVTVQAVDVSGNDQTSGGDIFILKLEQDCTVTNSHLCAESVSSDNIPGLPTFTVMTYIGSGQYQADYTITSHGTITVSVELVSGNGNYVEYYNTKDFTGTADSKTGIYYQDINYNYGEGLVTSISASNVSVRWRTKLVADYTETYTLYIQHDAAFALWLDGVLSTNAYHFAGPQTATITLNLEAGKQHDLRMDLAEGGGTCWNIIEWESPSQAREYIPADAQFLPERAGGYSAVHLVEIIEPSVPAFSTIETYQTTHIAGIIYSMTMQSRGTSSNVLAYSTDIYSVDLSQSDGLGSQQFTRTGSHTSGGIYSASMTPTIAGTYTMTVDMTNGYTVTVPGIQTEVSGSPFSVTVFPGQVDPLKCYTDLTGSPTETAAVAYDFSINFVDIWDNLHYQTMTDDLAGGMTVTVTADYVNHDNWLSPIGVDDDPNWQITYGTSISGAASDNNDGTMTGQVTIYRAGTYTLTIQVNGVNVIGSPFSSLEVQPTSLHAPTCVAVDIPIVMYAGYSYSFLIQGRDQFANNLGTRLATATGGSYSTIYTNVDDPLEMVTAKVTDDTTAGVYIVEVALDKKQVAGDYDLEVLLGGLEVPSLPIEIMPCTNTIAVELGLVAPRGIVNYLDTLDYTIRDDLVTIELPNVPIYCDQEPIQLLSSAIATFASGSEYKLSETELAEYGITLQASGESPTLTVFTDNIRHGSIVFELQISATVVEETTWADTTLLTINYIQTEIYVHIPPEREVPPLFDLETVSQATLQLEQDSQGFQALSPLSLDCTQPWSKALPSIVGEDEGNKFEIRVSLGQAGEFMQYEPISRQFTLVPTMTELADKYSIVVDVKNQSEQLTRYVIKVAYVCPDIEEAAPPPLSSYELRYDEDAPVPYIHSISIDGVAKIRFSEIMQPGASILDFETYSSQARRMLLGSAEDGEERLETVGHPSRTFQNFTQIHNSTVRINGTWHQSMQVAIEPADIEAETTCTQKLDFIWECIQFTPDELTLQLSFAWPDCVSSTSNSGDILVVTFNDQRLFKDSFDKLIWPRTELRERIRRQTTLSGSEQDFISIVGWSVIGLIAATSFVTILVSLLIKKAGGFVRLVNALKRLQIVVYSLFIQVFLVAHAETFLADLHRLVTLRVMEPGSIWKNAFAVLETEAVDIHFEALGYETSSALINLEPVITILVVLVGLQTLIYLFALFSPHHQLKKFSKKLHSLTWLNGTVLFVDLTFLISTVCCTVSIYKESRQTEVKGHTNYKVAIAVLLLTLSYLLCLYGYLFWRHQKQNTPAIDYRIRAAQENLSLRQSSLCQKKSDGPQQHDKNGCLRMALAYQLFTFVRRVALAFILLYGRQSLLTQLLFMNYSSILCIAVICAVRPYHLVSDNRLELWTEFTILLLFSLCLTQTDYVREQEGKNAMGWVIIGLLTLHIVSTFGFLFLQQVSFFYLRAKYAILKCQRRKRLRAERERRYKVNLYRQAVLEEIGKNDDVIVRDIDDQKKLLTIGRDWAAEVKQPVLRDKYLDPEEDKVQGLSQIGWSLNKPIQDREEEDLRDQIVSLEPIKLPSPRQTPFKPSIFDQEKTSFFKDINAIGAYNWQTQSKRIQQSENGTVDAKFKPYNQLREYMNYPYKVNGIHSKNGASKVDLEEEEKYGSDLLIKLDIGLTLEDIQRATRSGQEDPQKAATDDFDWSHTRKFLHEVQLQPTLSSTKKEPESSRNFSNS